MPRLTLAEIAENNCRACYYFQGVSLWCCRFRCVKYNTPRQQPATGRKRVKIINPGKTKTEINAENRDAKMMPLYKQGLSDREIADALGIKSKSNVCLWRTVKGLPPNPSPGNRLTPAEDQRRREVYDATQSDGAAAAIIGISCKAFCDWRNARGLPPKYRNTVVLAGTFDQLGRMDCATTAPAAYRAREQTAKADFKTGGRVVVYRVFPIGSGFFVIAFAV